MRTPRLPLLAPRLLSTTGLVALLAACGGGGGGSPKAANADDAAKAKGPNIGDLALAKGGLASLGGAGNREQDAPPNAVLDTFRLDLVEPKARVKLDGVLGEWPARVGARTLVKGTSEGTGFAAALQYDEQKIYVAGEVTEKSLVRTTSYGEGEDHASLLLAFPAGSAGTFVTYEIGLFAGKEGDVPGVVKFLSGGRGEVPGAKIVEAPTQGGYTFEAVIPWSAFPEARTVRVGLRGAARYYDAEPGASSGIRAIVATGGGSAEAPASMPWVPTETEQSIIDGLLIPKQLSQTPRAELFADVGGDSMKERVAVYDHFFTICGPGYRGGKEFFFRDLAADLLSLDARDVTGRGKDDLLVRRRFKVPGKADATREWFEVWSLLKGDEPVTTFAHEIAVTSGTKRVANAVHVAGKDIEVTTEPASGWEAGTYAEPQSTDVEPILLPWGAVKAQVFRFDAGKFAKAKEITQTPTPATAAAQTASEPRPVEPPTPTVRKGEGRDLSKQVWDQYKSDKGLPADTKARIDLEVHVDGDARPERVLLVGRDLVIFGPGFRGGNQYATLTLSQFAEPSDITDVSARDLTGDGGADLVVRGKRRVSASTKAGAAPETLEVEAMFVYEVRAAKVTRIFGIETAREQGGKRVQGLVQFVPARGGKSFEIDVRPGVAKGWTEKTFPWAEEKPGGGMEPLLLPWGKTGALRYAFDGTAYTVTK